MRLQFVTIYIYIVVCDNLLLLFVVNVTCPKMLLCVCNSFRSLPQLVVVVCYCFFYLNVTWKNEFCVCLQFVVLFVATCCCYLLLLFVVVVVVF